MLDISAYAEGLMHAKSLDIYHNYTIFINDSTVCRHNFELSLACLISYDYISSFDSEHPILIGRYRSYDQILWKNPINKFSFFFPTDAFGLNSLAAELMMEIYLSLQGFESELTAQINKVSACPQFNSLYQFLFLSDASKWSPANGLIKILPEDIVDLKRKTMLFEHSLSGIVGRDGLLIQYNGGAMQKFSFFILRTLYSFTRRLPIWFQFIVNDTIFLFRAPQKN